ncbi:MAG: HAD family phosphatase [Saprospiraceae bacterium]|nr:HAD family phosphatase [Pyrinomonadaceae bacterium]
MIKAILMDFNGVIINDEPIQLGAYREILKNEGIDLSDEDYYSSLGMDDKTFVRAAFDRAGKKPETNKILEITQAKTQKWREIISTEVPLFPGMKNFVRKMSKEFTLGVVSMANRQEIDHILETTGLLDCFSIVVSAENVSKCKPDPECYREGFRLIDSARTSRGHLPMIHGDCVVIEDSPPGVAAGKSAGLPVLGVTNTVGEDELRKAGADWVADYLDDWMPDSFRRVYS